MITTAAMPRATSPMRLLRPPPPAITSAISTTTTHDQDHGQDGARAFQPCQSLSTTWLGVRAEQTWTPANALARDTTNEEVDRIVAEQLHPRRHVAAAMTPKRASL